MNEPEQEPYVVHLPAKKFNSKSVRLADIQAAEEGKIDFPKSKRTFNKKFYYKKTPKWRQKKNPNWKKTSDDELKKNDTHDKPQRRFSLPSKSYPSRWNGQYNKNRNFSRQIEEAGIIATPAKKPGEDRGQFQRSFDTFMFGNRSILPDPPIINSGDYRLKYKSVQELIDSAAVSDKIYKYPVNDMTGTYQRSMTSAKFGASSVASSSSISKASTLSGLRTSSMVPVLQNQKIPKYSSKHSPIIPKPTSTRCLINNFNSEKSTASDNEYSLSMDDYVTQGNVLKKARNNQMELKQCVAGPISYLPPLLPSQMEVILSKTAEISHESQILNRVMTQYRDKRSNGSNDEKLLKNESEITEEQWFNMIILLDLPEMFIKEFIKNTMQILQEKNHLEKAGITIGQISNIHSTKRVLTLRDYTGEIKALIQENVIKDYSPMLYKDTILVLRNVTIQKSEGLPPFITITLNNIYMLYVDEYNKVLGHGAKTINGLGGKAVESNSEE